MLSNATDVDSMDIKKSDASKYGEEATNILSSNRNLLDALSVAR